MINKKLILFFLLSGFFFFTTCKKVEKVMMVSTGEVSDTTYNSANISGQIIDMGEVATQYGHCYGKNPNVTVACSKTKLGVPAGNGSFTSQLANLEAGTKYYIRSYLSDGNKTVYGKEVIFTTLPYEALYSPSEITIDGQIKPTEWSSARLYNILFTRNDGLDTKSGTLYLQHNDAWLYLGVKTNIDAGLDVYLSLRFDGNHDHILSGNSSEPHTDINIAYPSPGGGTEYERYDYLVSSDEHPVTPPTGTQQASSYCNNTKGSYEFKIKLSELNASTEQIIGFCLYNSSDTIPEHAYEFPTNSVIFNPSKWEHMKLNSLLISKK